MPQSSTKRPTVLRFDRRETQGKTAAMGPEEAFDNESVNPATERSGDSAKTDSRAYAEAPVDDSGAVVALPTVSPMPVTVAHNESLRRLCEQLSPVAIIENNLRLLVSGCSPGDGASTIAAAFALDLSQRLSLRTLLIDAHLRRPNLHRMFTRTSDSKCELLLDGPMQIRSTGWAWLDVATCCLGPTEAERRSALKRCEEIASHYAVTIVDLGVVRLDARMLALARATDPMLLVVRYGQTRRHELATTAAALRAANRTVAGVILNAATRSVAPSTGKSKLQ